MAAKISRVGKGVASRLEEAERDSRLVAAAKRANLSKVRELLALAPRPDRFVMREALCEAVLAQEPRIVQEMLAQGADPHLAGAFGVTAFSLAVQKPSVVIVKKLLKGYTRQTRESKHGSPLLWAAAVGQWQHAPLLRPYATAKDIAWMEHLRQEARAKTRRGKSSQGSLVIHHWTGKKEFGVSDGAYFVDSGRISICVQGTPKRKRQWPKEATLILRNYPLPARDMRPGDVYHLSDDGKAKPQIAPQASAYFGEFAWGIDMAFRVLGLRGKIALFAVDITCDDVQFYDRRAQPNRIAGRIRLGPATGKEPWLQNPARRGPAPTRRARKH